MCTVSSLSLTSLSHGPPPRDPAGHPGGEDVRAGRQADGMNGAGENQRLLQLQQGDVVILGQLVVVRMGGDLLHIPHLNVTVLLLLVPHAAVRDPVGLIVVPEDRGRSTLLLTDGRRRRRVAGRGADQPSSLKYSTNTQRNLSQCYLEHS